MIGIGDRKQLTKGNPISSVNDLHILPLGRGLCIEWQSCLCHDAKGESCQWISELVNNKCPQEEDGQRIGDRSRTGRDCTQIGAVICGEIRSAIPSLEKTK